MRSFTILSSLALSAISCVNAQTIYLAGDSTMAANGAGPGTNTDGWGQYLSRYVTRPVVNDAVGGTSARSFTESGRFNTLINTVKSGDYVVIEFGHNDGSAGAVDNGRQDAVGDGYNTTATVTDASGNQIVIHTFTFYIQNAIIALQAKGAIPIISSQTPNNGTTVIGSGNRFVQYAQIVGQRTGAVYIDHFDYVVQAYDALGQSVVNTFYPNDHTHTSPAGADVVAKAFVRGLLCSNSALKNFVNSAGKAVPNGCL